MSNFKAALQKDIEKGKSLIGNNTESICRTYIDMVERKYSNYIYGLDGIYLEAGRRTHINECTWPQITESVVDILESGIHTLQYLGGKLIPINKGEGRHSIEVNNHANASANNSSSISIDISVLFTETRKSIEDNLFGEMSNEAYVELLSKVDELEEINNTEYSRGKKWNKAKVVLDWVTDKGVNTFMQLTPIIMKMMENPS